MGFYKLNKHWFTNERLKVLNVLTNKVRPICRLQHLASTIEASNHRQYVKQL